MLANAAMCRNVCNDMKIAAKYFLGVFREGQNEETEGRCGGDIRCYEF